MNTTLVAPKAMLLLGCPEVPVQTSLAIYLTDLLNKSGAQVVIAGNNAALELVRTADPAEQYIRDTADLDATIGALASKEMDADICYVFIHNDAGVSYLATASVLVSGECVGIIFGKNAQALGLECDDLGLANIWAKAVHNPRPLKAKIHSEVERWAVSTK
ncbi:MAG: DUF1890 family protein [Methanosarcinales archaeon]|nr:DUF1890 domain-containing protein [ANME-2 cluster archaeon]MDF1532675.1 DUF1890 family protein [ANME-2 cluster archaeon]MDW7776581.1 DUF1890 family protein [Methanosarcinales archaeon]